jgi:hypothetical protein
LTASSGAAYRNGQMANLEEERRRAEASAKQHEEIVALRKKNYQVSTATHL